MNWMRFWIVLTIGIAFVVLQGFFSYIDGFLTRSQMLQKHGLEKGNSFFQHGGMYCDVFVISPIVAYVTSKYALSYFSLRNLIFLVVAIFLWGMAFDYFRHLPLPEAHNHDGHLTATGWIHFGFAVAATWILAMFYFANPSMRDLVVVSSLLTPFFFLGVYKFDRDWHWNPGAVGATILGPVAVWSVVVWRAYFD